MWIDVKIPYEPEGKLALAYNRAMENTTAPWVLLLDHDLFLALNPHWYDMCLETVKDAEKLNPFPGLITCTFNGGREQAANYVDKTTDLEKHVGLAKEAYTYYDTSLVQVDTHQIAGLFMLVNREVWEKIPFKDQGKGVNKIDHDFCSRLLSAGYGIYVMKGLYVYHKQRVRKLKWDKN